jgi:hypothetical protein
VRRFTLCFAALALAAVAQAGLPVDVTYNLSGTPGNWVYDFTVTNNIKPADMDIYFFGVELSARDIVGSPTNWDPNVWASWNNSGYGGSNINYNNNWIDQTFSTLFPGQKLNGFKVHSTDQTAEKEVNWFLFGYGTQGGQYVDGGNFNSNGNPGFEGVAVPEPATLGALALGLLAALRRR